MRALLLTSAVIGSLAQPAFAHVSVQPGEAPARSFQEYTVRIPTERDTPTLSVRMVFPEGFEVLRFRPMAGWKYEIERDAKGRIAAVTWSGAKISREEYQVFGFMARAANPGTYQLNAYQQYEGGETVGWVNPQEPQPAPKVTIVAAPAADAAASATAPDPFAGAPAAGAAAAPATAAASAPATGRTTQLMAAASLVISLGSLMVAWRRKA